MSGSSCADDLLSSALSDSASKGLSSELMTEKKPLLPWLSQTPFTCISFPSHPSLIASLFQPIPSQCFTGRSAQ